MPRYSNNTSNPIQWRRWTWQPGQRIDLGMFVEPAVGLTLVPGGPAVKSPILLSGEYTLAAPTETPATKAFEITTGKILTIAAVGAGEDGNGLLFTFEANSADTLAVTNPSGKTILVKLANATDTKNAAALIQTALQALVTVDGVSVAGMTATANAAFAASPPITVSPAITAAALEDGADAPAATLQVIDIPYAYKVSVSVYVKSGTGILYLGDDTLGVALDTTNLYEGTHQWTKIGKLTLSTIEPTVFVVVVEEAE